MNRFIKIQNFHNMWRMIQRLGTDKPTIKYMAKVKLHGTNGGVRIEPDGTVVAQSRNRDLTIEKDNAGFAYWVKEHEDKWSGLKKVILSYLTTLV